MYTKYRLADEDTVENNYNLDLVLAENNLSSNQMQRFSMTVQQTYIRASTIKTS